MSHTSYSNPPPAGANPYPPQGYGQAPMSSVPTGAPPANSWGAPVPMQPAPGQAPPGNVFAQPAGGAGPYGGPPMQAGAAMPALAQFDAHAGPQASAANPFAPASANPWAPAGEEQQQPNRQVQQQEAAEAPAAPKDVDAQLKQRAAELKKRNDRAKRRAKEKKEEEDKLRTVPPPTLRDVDAKLMQGNKAKWLGRFKFHNRLPPLPAKPKMLPYPFQKDRFYTYNTTSLEATHKHELLSEPDLGIPIDLIDQDAYSAPDNVGLQTEDRELLELGERAIQQATGVQASKESLRPRVTWLRRTEYMANDLWDPVYKQSENMDIRKFEVEDKLRELGDEDADIDMDRNQQIRVIERTFEKAKLAPKHPTKPHLKPVSVRPLLPDFKYWPNGYVHVIYDAPIEGANGKTAEAEPTKGTILRSFGVPSGPEGAMEQYLGLLVPKRKRDETDEAGASSSAAAMAEAQARKEYAWTREYAFDVRRGGQGDKATSFLLTFDDDAVRYDVFEQRINLRKKKAKISHGVGEVYQRPSEVFVDVKDLSAEDVAQRDARTKSLNASGNPDEGEEETEGAGDSQEGGDASGAASK